MRFGSVCPAARKLIFQVVLLSRTGRKNYQRRVWRNASVFSHVFFFILNSLILKLNDSFDF